MTLTFLHVDAANFLFSPHVFLRHSICSWFQNGTSSVGDCHQSGTDWGCGGSCLPPQTSVLSHCRLPHQEQSQHGGKTSAKECLNLDSGLNNLNILFINIFKILQNFLSQWPCAKSVSDFCCFLYQVLYIQAFVLVFLLGKFMRKVFFGQLRAAEMEVKFCLWLWLTYLLMTHV